MKIARFHNLKFLLLVVLLAGAFFSSSLGEKGNWTNSNSNFYGSPGTLDFIEYWTAFQIASQDKNPYDPALMKKQQIQLGRKTKTPLMMWNPPWTLTLLSPVLVLPFKTASILWLMLNIAFLVFAAIYSWKLVCNKRFSAIPCAISAVFCYPALQCALMGQTALFMTAAMAGFLYAINSRNYILAGLFLLPLTIKAHLVYLVFLALLFWSIQERSYKSLSVFAGSFLILVLINILSFGNLYSFWLDSMTNPTIRVQTLSEWRTATVVTWIRIFYFKFFDVIPFWPVYVVPLITIIIFSYTMIKHKIIFSWKHHFPILLSVSLLSSAYGWTFDSALLLIVQVSIVATLFNAPYVKSFGHKITGSLCIVELAAFILHQNVLRQHEFFIWYPIAMLAIWIIVLKNLTPHNS